MADVEKERKEQAKGPEAQAHELEELTKIYEDRGVSPLLARQASSTLALPAKASLHSTHAVIFYRACAHILRKEGT